MEIELVYIVVFLPSILLGLLGGIMYRYLYKKLENIPFVKNLNGRELTEFLVREENLVLTLSESRKYMENYFKEGILYLDSKVLSLPTLTSSYIVLDQISSLIQKKEFDFVDPLRKVTKGFVVYMSAFSFLSLLVSLIFLNNTLFMLSVYIQGVCLFVSIGMSLLELDRSFRVIELSKKYSLYEKDEGSLVSRISSFRVFVYFEYMVLTILKFLYYTLDTFKK